MMCSVCLVLVMLLQSVAFAEPDSQPVSDFDQYLVSVETVSAEEAEEKLPPEVYQALYGDAFDDEISLYGLEEPKTSNQYNLREKGKYYFPVSTKLDLIYSDYVFTGHSGHLTVFLKETSLGSSNYKFIVYRRGTLYFDTEIDTYEFPRGSEEKGYIICNEDDLVYFCVDPIGQSLSISKASYLGLTGKGRPQT